MILSLDMYVARSPVCGARYDVTNHYILWIVLATYCWICWFWYKQIVGLRWVVISRENRWFLCISLSVKLQVRDRWWDDGLEVGVAELWMGVAWIEEAANISGVDWGVFALFMLLGGLESFWPFFAYGLRGSCRSFIPKGEGMAVRVF